MADEGLCFSGFRVRGLGEAFFAITPTSRRKPAKSIASCPRRLSEFSVLGMLRFRVSEKVSASYLAHSAHDSFHIDSRPTLKVKAGHRSYTTHLSTSPPFPPYLCGLISSMSTSLYCFHVDAPADTHAHLHTHAD